MVALPAWSASVIAELENADRRADGVARGLTAEQLIWKPADHRWSIGQCLQHLYVANQVYLPPIARALDGQPHSPVQDIAPGWLGRWFISAYIEPSAQSKRLRAPAKIAPGPHVDPSVLDLFLQSNEVARELVRRAAANDVNRIRFRNPFVPLLRFTVGTGLEVVWRHQSRHLLQAERIRHDPAFPESGRDRRPRNKP